MPLDREDAWRVVQLLAHVLADMLQGAPARADGGLGLVMPIDARRVGRQRCALGARLRRCRLLRIEQLLELGFDGRDIGVDRFVEQHPLLSVELLALLAELDAL